MKCANNLGGTGKFLHTFSRILGRGLKKNYNHKKPFLSRLMFLIEKYFCKTSVLYTQIQQQNSTMSFGVEIIL
jgi:hypothetical protein